MCKVFKVDKSSYYNWIKNGCLIQKVDEKLNELIEIIFIQSRQTYGTRRIKDKLLERYGVIVSRKRIRNILRQLGLFVKMKRRFKVMTTDSNHSLPIAPNILNRDFYASKVDEKYVGDITYIPTSEGWQALNYFQNFLILLHIIIKLDSFMIWEMYIKKKILIQHFKEKLYKILVWDTTHHLMISF